MKIRIYCLADMVAIMKKGPYGIILWMQDVNNRYWSQYLHNPYDRIEVSEYKTRKQLNDAIDIEQPIRWFRGK